MDSELFSANDKNGTYTIGGLTEPGARIDYGRFQIPGTLSSYENDRFSDETIRLTATDAAGNVSHPAYAMVGVGSGGILVTVNGGSGGGGYIEGETVRITADAPPEGKVFDKWATEDGVDFANANSSTTTFTMPANQ